MTLFGTLVISATRAVPNLDVVKLPHVLGKHVKGRYNGMWTEANDCVSRSIYIPQRRKRLSVATTNPDTIDALCHGLETLDAQHGEARQVYKLQRLVESMTLPCAATVNISSAESDSDTSGAFYLLACGVPLYVGLVFDIEERSVQLVWSTTDFKRVVQQRRNWRYVFYYMPQLVNRALFVHTQQLCSSWWRLMRDSQDDLTSLLRAANAIELTLFKDPDVKSYS